MNASADQLDPQTHARIFSDEVIPESRLSEVSSQVRPKAIILGGQPGAGKGGLADAAKNELRGDVVTIDPDALRKYHPPTATPANGPTNCAMLFLAISALPAAIHSCPERISILPPFVEQGAL